MQYCALATPPAQYPEGPLLADDGSLYFVDYAADAVHHRVGCPRGADAGSATTTVRLPRGSGPCGLALVRALDDVVVACYGSHELRMLRSGRTVAAPYPNDLCADEAGGGVFVTSSASRDDPDPFRAGARASGTLLYLDAREMRLHELAARPIHYANGVALLLRSGCGDGSGRGGGGDTLYVSEHLRNRVLAFDVERRGPTRAPTLSAARVHARLPRTPRTRADAALLGPDGLAVDARDGSLYVAHFGAGRLLRYVSCCDPQRQRQRQRHARCVRSWDLALPCVTNVALDPRDGTAYVTVAAPAGGAGHVAHVSLADSAYSRRS
jgi:sugar lactone lactonase YvrE